MLDFASYLRDRPDDGEEKSDDLAARFGLPIEVVRESLRVISTGRRTPDSRGAIERAGLGNRLRRPFAAMGGILRNHPVVSAITLGLAMAAAIPLGRVLGAPFGPVLVASVGALAGAGLIVLNFLRAQLRYALITAFLFVAPILAALMLTFLFASADELRIELADVAPTGGARLAYFVVLLVNWTLTAAVLTIIAALLGGYRRVRKEIRDEERRDRLVLLQRIFDLKARLQEPRGEDGNRDRPNRWLEYARARWLAVAAGLGLTVGLGEVLIRLTVGIPQVVSQLAEVPPLEQLVPAIAISTLSLTLLLLSGFAAGNWLRGIAAGVAFYMASNLPILLPVPGLGWGALTEPFRESAWMLLVLLINPLFGMVAGMGAAIEASAARQSRIRASDQAALLSEIVRLQQVLQTGAADLCVMSVDVVKSILMKEGADRYEVEVSFRAFQEFIERNVRRHGGSIHSTAGDGAVAEFHGVPEAFACARAIQSSLPEFNAGENRLQLPFLVRVGLHCGRVHGGLDEVVFTRVIDIAAHIEKVAPGGGIALSEVVTGQLPGEAFTLIAEQIDEQNVFISLSPAV